MSHLNLPKLFSPSKFTSFNTNSEGRLVEQAIMSDIKPNIESRLPFRYSKLAYGLSVSLFIQLYAHQSAFAANDLTLSSNSNALIAENVNNEFNYTSSDEDLEEALIALKLKRAVEQGLIDPSVYEDYQRETLHSQVAKSNPNQARPSQARPNNETQYNPNSQRMTANPAETSSVIHNDGVDLSSGLPNNLQSSNSQSNNNNSNSEAFINDDLLNDTGLFNDSAANDNTFVQSPEQIEKTLSLIDKQVNEQLTPEFEAPVARLNSVNAPIGFDTNLDNLKINPSNRGTLGLADSQISVEDSVEEAAEKAAIQATTSLKPAENSFKGNGISPEGKAQNEIDAKVKKASINPDDYLPQYDSQNANSSVNEGLANLSDKKEAQSTAEKPGFFKRIYNDLFNDGFAPQPKISAKIYLQPEPNQVNANPANLIEVDDDVQPAKNIKAVMENITVESITDFTAVIPKLNQEALNAAQAVGYYDIKLRFTKVDNDKIAVVIERLGDPVVVSSRIVDIRGEGSDLEEFQEIVEEAPPQPEDVFNHGTYKETKAKIEVTSEQFGFFDGQWLNKSVDIILPDNTADVDLIYDTGERYHFDEVVFFTIDPETGQLTTDPDKLPVKSELLHQLHEFKAGDRYYGPLVTEFTNDLSATRYFNSVNVETILPRGGNGTLEFDNNSNESQNQTQNQEQTSSSSNSENPFNGLGQNSNANDINGQSPLDELFSEDSDRSDELSNEDVSAELEPLEYSVDLQTSEKLNEIALKAERLSRLPDDRVLDETDEEAKNLLGKISNAVSNAVEKVFPDDEDSLSETALLPIDLSQTILADRKTPQQVEETKSVPLYVFVTADKPKDVDLGIGYGTDTGVRAVARLEHNLINRDGYQAGVSIGASKIHKSINLHASRPWNHPLDDTLTGNISYEQENINQGEGNFDLQTNTVKAGIARNIRSDTGWNRTYSLKYRLDDLESGVKGPDRENLPVPFNREGASFDQEALLIGYRMEKTTADNVANPTKGFRQYYSLEAGSDSALTDTDMAIARAGVNGVYSFGDMKKHQVVGSLDAGYIWADEFEDVPYKLRFFAGGDRSIRGYDYNSLSALDKGYLVGGQVLAVGSTEYNYEFKPGLRGAVFADFGNAYDTNFETETKLGVGFGVRWASPVGMVRLDLAAGVLEESVPVRLHFFIGSPLQ